MIMLFTRRARGFWARWVMHILSGRCQRYFQMDCPVAVGYMVLELCRKVRASDRDLGIVLERDVVEEMRED